MAAGKCKRCGYTWSRFQNGGHKCPDLRGIKEYDDAIEQSAEALANLSPALIEVTEAIMNDCVTDEMMDRYLCVNSMSILFLERLDEITTRLAGEMINE